MKKKNNNRICYVHPEKMIIKNQLMNLLYYEKIITSLNRAKRLNTLVSKIINWAKKDNLHSKRLILSEFSQWQRKKIFNKLLKELTNRYRERNQGYSRINKICHRRGDNALRVSISLV